MKLLVKKYLNVFNSYINSQWLFKCNECNDILSLSPASSFISECKNSKLWSLPILAWFPRYSWPTWSRRPWRSSRIPWFARQRWCSWINGCSWTPRGQRIRRYLICVQLKELSIQFFSGICILNLFNRQEFTYILWCGVLFWATFSEAQGLHLAVLHSQGRYQMICWGRNLGWPRPRPEQGRIVMDIR